MKTLYDREIFTEEYIIKWYYRKKKLDKNSKLYDRKSEKAFREIIA